MMRTIKLAVACLTVLVVTAGQVQAGIITFIPPMSSSPTSTSGNDGYADGRGIVFKMQGDVQIDSIGILHHLTAVGLSYEIAEVSVSPTSGILTTIQPNLSSGGRVVTNSVLEWIDFAIIPLQLTSGNYYHIEFKHSGNGNQNFFYNDNNAGFTEGDFTQVKGTGAANASVNVMPAIRVNAVALSAVPEPSSLAMFGIGVWVVGFGGRRRREKNQTVSA